MNMCVFLIHSLFFRVISLPLLPPKGDMQRKREIADNQNYIENKI